MLHTVVTLILSWFATTYDAEVLRSSAPLYLTADTAGAHLIAARVAASATGIEPEILLSIAWHESRYDAGAITHEPGHRVSCGSMTPEPHAPPCSDWETSLVGGYLEGAKHLRTWLDICRGSMRCALLAYGGGRQLVATCARGDHVFVRAAVDACDLADVFLGRAAWLRRRLATPWS